MREFTLEMFQAMRPRLRPKKPRFQYFLDFTGTVYRRKIGQEDLQEVKVTKNNYPKVSVFGFGIPLHQIVARVFIGKCPFGYEVDHIDRNKNNYTPENLRYVTHQENMDSYFQSAFGSK